MTPEELEMLMDIKNMLLEIKDKFERFTMEKK